MAQVPDIGTYYFTQGVLGITVLVLGAVCIKLYNKLQAVQSQQLTDAKEVTEKVVTVLQNNTQSNLVLAEKIEASKKAGTV